jgi:long-chain acyl-CoA synthetase
VTGALAALLDAAPDVAVHTESTETSRTELVAAADAVAADLAALGIGPGDVVGVRLGNDARTIATLFGVWRAGAAYLPLNPRSPEAEVAGVLATARPAAIIDADGARRLEGASPVGPDVALLQFTSGTTGAPKPVPLLHAPVLDLLDRVVGSIRTPGAPAADPARAPMPNLVPVTLSVWAGIYQVLFAFRVGAPVVLMERFDTATFARLVARHGIRSTVLPPAAMTMLTDDEAVTDLAPLRMIRSISSPLSPVQARRFHDRFGVVVLNSYGQTELGGEVVGWTAADSREHGQTKLGSVGRPHGGVEVRADEGSGELLVRTPATAAGTVGGDFTDRLLDGGWFRTGDLGRVDDDGFVWVEGRVSDSINRGGLKVFPAQVEEALRLAPGVRDVAVVGMPDERLGEVPWAFVVGAVDEGALSAWCRERLSAYKVPARFVPVGELPRNDAGKVLKHQLPSLTQVSETP